ncbi:effector-associated domain 2-containing protein, partial [Amycolatopsis mediterranei]|uniref:effector-associated domain 2-containing protein n=1 Tax=Amycolatopsis mediterranei TaxID=33910 RepID=UPI00335CAEEE
MIGEAVVDVLAEAGLAEELAVVVSLVGKTLGVELAVPRHPTPRSSLIEVVSACERYQNGMQALVGAVAFMRPGSPESERVRDLVERPRVLDLLPRAERHRLHQWLAGVEVPRPGELVH